MSDSVPTVSMFLSAAVLTAVCVCLTCGVLNIVPLSTSRMTRSNDVRDPGNDLTHCDLQMLTLSSCYESRQCQSIRPITDRDVSSAFVADCRYATPVSLGPQHTNERNLASPHDAHLLSTFSSESNVVRVLDVRQPGQALLELKGHSAPLNCVEWSPSRRGVLASGGDDSLVLLWDLINQNNAVPVSPPTQVPGAQAPTPTERGPAAAWQCDYEVSNISWSPQGRPNHTGSPREWLGVCGGRGIWGVSL